MQSNLLSKTYHSGGYLRLSHSDIAASGDTNAANQEAMQSNSIENQKEYIEEYLKTKPEIISTTFYVDDGYSGVNFERPSFQRMLQDIRENKIDCVIVKDDCVIKARTPQTLENRHFLRIGTEFRAIQRPQRAAYHIETS